MRQWMNLIESAGVVPDLTQFVTPHLIDEIIDQDRWVHHGASLEDWLDTSCYATEQASEIGLSDEEAQELENMPHAQARHTPQFRKCVEHWVKEQARRVQQSFVNGEKYDNIKPFHLNTILTRLIRAETPKNQLGVYWTELAPQAIARLVPDHPNHPVIVLQTRAAFVTVDWYETLRSRLDYSNGCDEAEVQLLKGSPVTNIRVGLINYKASGSDAFFDPKKIVWKKESTSGIA